MRRGFFGARAVLLKVIPRKGATKPGATCFCCMLKCCSTIDAIMSGFSLSEGLLLRNYDSSAIRIFKFLFDCDAFFFNASWELNFHQSLFLNISQLCYDVWIGHVLCEEVVQFIPGNSMFKNFLQNMFQCYVYF